MKVVSYSEAARIVGVSRQAIYSLKKVNDSLKGKYPFFCHSPENGKPGVDIENNQFLDYLKRNKVFRVKPNREKQQEEGSESKAISPESEENAVFTALIDACTESVQELFKPSVKKMKDLNDLIMVKFGERMG